MSESATQMDLPGGGKAPCRNCGRWGHEHDKEKVFSENGRWHWVYTCPTSESPESLLERYAERIGKRAARHIHPDFRDLYESSGEGGEDAA